MAPSDPISESFGIKPRYWDDDTFGLLSVGTIPIANITYGTYRVVQGSMASKWNYNWTPTTYSVHEIFTENSEEDER